MNIETITAAYSHDHKIKVYTSCPGTLEYSDECVIEVADFSEYLLSCEERWADEDLDTWQVLSLLSFLDMFNVPVEVSEGKDCQIFAFETGKNTSVKLCAYEDHTTLFINGIPNSGVGYRKVCKELAETRKEEANVI